MMRFLCLTAPLAISMLLPQSKENVQNAPSSESKATQGHEFVEVIKRFISAVVLIEVQDATGATTKTGSGFIVSADGKIVTNYHVIKGTHSAYVKLSNGASFKVEGLVASDQEADFAVLKVAGNDLPVLQLGDSDRAMLGQPVVAIGSPLGLQPNALPLSYRGTERINF